MSRDFEILFAEACTLSRIDLEAGQAVLFDSWYAELSEEEKEILVDGLDKLVGNIIELFGEIDWGTAGKQTVEKTAKGINEQD